jgi:hypothetical protein
MTLPAALSILTTTFKEGRDRNTALGIWGAVGGLASAAGVLLGGLLVEGPGWRWVMFVNPVACVLVLLAIFRLISGDRPPSSRLNNFDIRGAVLATAGMLLLVYALVKAPTVGWGTARTIGELAGALVLLAGFVVNERRVKNPLAPLSIFRINGLGYADATQLIAFAGFLALFFFLTLYMQNVLGYSPIQAGLAYLPLTFAVGIAATISAQLVTRYGRADRRGRSLLAIANPGARLIRQRPARADARPLRGRGSRVRRGDHRGQRRRALGQGGPGRGAAQRVAAARRSARTGDPVRGGHQPHQPPARRPRRTAGCAHERLPAGAAGRKHLRARVRTHSHARDQHPRRDARRDHAATARPGGVSTHLGCFAGGRNGETRQTG